MTGTARRSFARVVVVDWSANARPKRGADSIWIASLDPPVEDRCDAVDDVVLANPPTRAEAGRLLDELLDTAPGPMLLGVDFSLGFPAGTVAALGRGSGWQDTWGALADEIVDDEANVNNRFEVAARMNADLGGISPGPFWGCPPRYAGCTLTTTKPPRDHRWPSQWRETELVLRASGHRPFDCWQLMGAGSVASQSLVGIAALQRLRLRHGARVEVWPFTTGLRAPERRFDTVVIAEVWPSQRPIRTEIGEVRDAAQVRATAAWLADVDASGELDAFFAPDCADGRRHAVEHEEGWVLGVGTPTV